MFKSMSLQAKIRGEHVINAVDKIGDRTKIDFSLSKLTLTLKLDKFTNALCVC